MAVANRSVKKCVVDVWASLMKVASYNADLKVIAQGTTVGAALGGLAGFVLYSLFSEKEERTDSGAGLATIAGAVAGGALGGSVASAWVGKNIVQILEEMGPEKRDILKKIAVEEAKKLAYTIGRELLTKLARRWLIASMDRAFGVQLE